MLILSWKDKDTGETKFVRFDVVSTESHEAVMSITTHPVEKGPSVTDHAEEDHDTVSIEAFVSDKPLYSNPGVEDLMGYSFTELSIPEKSGGAPIFTPGGATQAVVGAVSSLVSGEPSKRAIVLKATGEMPNRGRAIYELLTKARKDRCLVTISTKLRDVEDMLIERIANARTTETSGGMPFQIDLRKVEIVESEIVKAPEPTEARGALQKSKGSKNAQDDKDKKKEQKAKSIAASLFDGAAGALGGIGF